jgi:mycobactin polyketide synthetase MbtD
VLLSADDPETLRREAAAVADYVAGHDAVTPDRVADMLFRTRLARRYRALIMAGTRADLLTALQSVAAGAPHPDVVSSTEAATPRRIAYVFPGQGSQRPGMGRMLYDHSEAYRTAVQECDKVFHELYAWSPLPYLLEADTPADENARTVQPALFMQMVGIAAMWDAAGIRPAAVVGHSQGEIAAAYVAGTQTLRDAVRIVTTRADIVDGLQLTGYSMAVLGVDREECEDLLARHAGFAELSVVNSPHILAISGERVAVLDIVGSLDAAGKFAREIKVRYPAHTSYVSRMREELSRTVRDDMDNHAFLPSEIDFVGGTLGDRVGTDTSIVDYWYLNLRNRVRFDRAVAVAADRGVDTFLEISEHPTLMLAMQENLAGLPSKRSFQALGTSRRTAEDLREFTRNLATLAVHDLGFDWDALRDDASDRPELPLLDFPNTRTNPQKLWAVYPYAARGEVQDAGASGAEKPTEAVIFTPRRYVERWKHLPRRTLVPPRTLALLDPTGRCAELVSAIRDVAPRRGATVANADQSCDTLVVLVPPPVDTQMRTAVADLAEFLGEWAVPADLSGVRDLWLVTSGGEQVLDTDVPDPFHAAVQAGFRCLAAEHVGISIRHVDLAADADPAVSAKGLVDALHTAGEPELALRDGAIHAKRLLPDDRPGQAPDASELREVVIVGGTGKLGLDFCEQFAEAGAGRITLVSRSSGDAVAAQRIRDIEQRTRTRIVNRTCDVSDETAARALGEAFGDSPASLIVHAAVDYSAAAAELGRATVHAAAAAKAVVLDNLVRYLPRTADGRILLCSSLSATLGGRGHMIYSAVNRLLDAAAGRYRAQGVPCSSVQWGLWRAVGADNAEALAKISGAGLLPMDPGAAIAAGCAERSANSIVAAADWERIKDLYSVLGYGPLFEDLPAERPLPVAETRETAVADQPVTTDLPDGDDRPDTEPAPADTADAVRQALRIVMGLNATDVLDGSVPLVALGLDSLQALDLRKRIESDLSRDLPVTAILGGASLDEVVALLT